MYQYRRPRYTPPENLSYEQFQNKYAYELVNNVKEASQNYKHANLKFDFKPDAPSCPLNRGVYSTTPLMSRFNLYYHNMFKTLMFHYKNKLVVSLAGADLRRWFRKLGRVYQADNPPTFQELITHLQELNIQGAAPKVTPSIVNHSSTLIGSYQNPIPQIPFTKAMKCSKCGYSTNEGTKELQRHWKRSARTHGVLKIGGSLGDECFRQCINPLQGKGGASRRYFVVHIPQDYFLKDEEERQGGVGDERPEADPLKSLSLYSQDTIDNVVEVEYIIDGVKLQQNIQSILTNMMLKQRLFFEANEVDISILTPLAAGDTYGSFTTIKAYQSIRDYTKTWSQVIIGDYIQLNLEGQGVLVNGVAVDELPESKKPESTQELVRNINSIIEDLRERDYEFLDHYEFGQLLGTIGSTPEIKRLLVDRFNDMYQEQAQLGYRLLEYLQLALTQGMKSSTRNRVFGEDGPNEDPEENDFLRDDDEDNIHPEDRAGLIRDLAIHQINDEQLDRVVGADIAPPAQDANLPYGSRFVTLRSCFKILEHGSPSDRVIKSQRIMSSIKSFYLEVLYRSMNRSNNSSISAKLAKAFKESGEPTNTTLAVMKALKRICKRIRDAHAFTNSNVVFEAGEECVYINSLGASLSLEQTANVFTNITNEMNELISNLLVGDMDILSLQLRFDTIYNREHNIYNPVITPEHINQVKARVLESMEIVNVDEVGEEQMDLMERWLEKHQKFVGLLMLYVILSNTHIRAPTFIGYFDGSSDPTNHLGSVFLDSEKNYVYLTSEATKSQKTTTKLKSLCVFESDVSKGIIFYRLLPEIFRYVHDIYAKSTNQLNDGRVVIRLAKTLFRSCVFGFGINRPLDRDLVIEELKSKIRSQFEIPGLNFQLFRRCFLSLQSNYHTRYEGENALMPALNTRQTFENFYLRFRGIPMPISNSYYRWYRENYESWNAGLRRFQEQAEDGGPGGDPDGGDPGADDPDGGDPDGGDPDGGPDGGPDANPDGSDTDVDDFDVEGNDSDDFAERRRGALFVDPESSDDLDSDPSSDNNTAQDDWDMMTLSPNQNFSVGKGENRVGDYSDFLYRQYKISKQIQFQKHQQQLVEEVNLRHIWNSIELVRVVDDS